jgi:hypothetical protein
MDEGSDAWFDRELAGCSFVDERLAIARSYDSLAESTAAKSLPLEASPQLGAIALPGRPLFVKPWQMQLQRTLPDAEDV